MVLCGLLWCMGVIIPLGFGQYSLPFRLTGDQDEMIVTCGFTDDGTSPPNSIAESISTALFATPSFAASTWSNVYSFGPGRVTVQRALGPIEGVGTTSRVGTNASFSPCTNNCAVLCRKRTARGGRQGRGRFYLPIGLTGEGNVTAVGILLETVRAQLQTDLETWRAQMASGTQDLVLLHGDPLVGVAPPPDLITAFEVDPLIATQRTRLRR